MNGQQAYDQVQNGGGSGGGSPQIAWRSSWLADEAIANDAGIVDRWTTTNQGPYTLDLTDKNATDWVLEPDNGDRPPRGA
jgi:hypothetical protein